MPVHRMTLFKAFPDASILSILDAYGVLGRTQQKASLPPSPDGKPYILRTEAHKTVPDPRTGGYNVVAHTHFETLDDMRYYDEHCGAHQTLKEAIRSKVQGPPMAVIWET